MHQLAADLIGVTDPQMIVHHTGVTKVNGFQGPRVVSAAVARDMTPLLMMTGPTTVVCIAAVGNGSTGPRDPMVG